MGKLKVAVYAIAKDEQANVDTFMASCQGADLVIVGVDSGDTTGDLLEGCGAKVVYVDQKFRFDHYRNYVLSQIPEDYDVCVSLDLDETLCDGWRDIIDDVWCDKTTRLHYYLRWSKDRVIRYDRIHARKGYRWRHPTHEAVYADDIDSEVATQSNLIVTHNPDIHKDRGKDLGLLQLAVEEDPSDTRSRWYLVRQCYYHSDYRACIYHASEYVMYPMRWREEVMWVCIYAARAYHLLGQTPNALAWANWAARLCDNRRDGHMELVRLHIEDEDYDSALLEANNALAIKHDDLAFYEGEKMGDADILHLIDTIRAKRSASQ